MVCLFSFGRDTVLPAVSGRRSREGLLRRQCGFICDVDHQPNENFRVVQFTPPGSACSITFGIGMSTKEPGLRGIPPRGDRIEAARAGSSLAAWTSATVPLRRGGQDAGSIPRRGDFGTYCTSATRTATPGRFRRSRAAASMRRPAMIDADARLRGGRRRAMAEPFVRSTRCSTDRCPRRGATRTAPERPPVRPMTRLSRALPIALLLVLAACTPPRRQPSAVAAANASNRRHRDRADVAGGQHDSPSRAHLRRRSRARAAGRGRRMPRPMRSSDGSTARTSTTATRSSSRPSGTRTPSSATSRRAAGSRRRSTRAAGRRGAGRGRDRDLRGRRCPRVHDGEGDRRGQGTIGATQPATRVRSPTMT